MNFTYTLAPSSTRELQVFHNDDKCLRSATGSCGSALPTSVDVEAVVVVVVVVVVLCQDPLSPIPKYTLSVPDSWRGSNTAVPICTKKEEASYLHKNSPIPLDYSNAMTWKSWARMEWDY